MKKIFLVGFSALFVSSVSLAKTVYIAPNGDNANNGLSDSAPVKTLKEAYTKANAAGDVIQFLDGTYTTENFPEATDVMRNLTIAGNSSDCTAVIWDLTGSELDWVVAQGSGVATLAITGITFCNSSKPGMVRLINFQISFEMSNCVLRDSTARVIPFIFPANDCSYTFTDVKFKDITSHNGASVIGPSTRTQGDGAQFTFLRCQFENCGQDGSKNGGCIWNPASSSKWTFTDCTVSGCTDSFVASTVDNSGSGGFMFSGTPLVLSVNTSTFSNNVAYGAGGAFRLEGDKIETEFTGCTFTDNRTTNGSGGAVSCNQATQTNRFFTCTFERNQSEIASGGGIYADRTHTLQVSNCTFRACAAKTNGGAIMAYGPSIGIEDSVFEENTSESNGGAVCSHYNGTQARDDHADFRGCTFLRNTTVNGGGAYLNNVTASFADCTFRTNRAVKAGGVYGGGKGDFFLTDSLFDACVATHETSQADGGALWFQRTGDCLRFERTQFLNCSAKKFGGVVYIYNTTANDIRFDTCRFVANKSSAGSVFYRNTNAGEGPVVFRNSLFEGNQTTDLGAQAAKILATAKGTGVQQLITVENCTFVKNLTGSGYVIGSADKNVDTPWSVTNTIFWDNEGNGRSTSGKRDLVYLGITPGLSTFANNISEQNLVNPDDSIGSVNSDPLFTHEGSWTAVDSTGIYNIDGDYTLTKKSPARDAGATLAWMTADAKDLAGNPRVIGNSPDIGAYEFKPVLGLVVIFR